MSNYDFRPLSPYEFEILSRDLLQAELGVRLESFKPGPDQGIDFRAAIAYDQALIVQCKHYAGSGFSKLRSDLERKELSKIRALAPSRYVLTTSTPLSPLNKADLKKLLSPYCAPKDIFGREDLNNLLGRHPDVEGNHYKLWITSSEVLGRVLHAETFLQAEMESNELERRLALHVQTEAKPRAWEILEKHNCCIISGIPGIGKTTLAEILIVDLVARGFDLIVARTHVGEALERLNRNRSQVVYYDDFLGHSSFAEKLVKNEEQTLLRLLQRARRTNNLKVILTTREYILAEAIQQYEKLKQSDLEITKCILDLESYSRLDRARILYNHLHYFQVPPAFIAAMLDGDRYKRVIDHPNYSPRVIEWMTQNLEQNGSPPGCAGEAAKV